MPELGAEVKKMLFYSWERYNTVLPISDNLDNPNDIAGEIAIRAVC